MTTRRLPQYRYVIRQTVAMFVVASAALLALVSVCSLLGITLSDADPFLPLTR